MMAEIYGVAGSGKTTYVRKQNRYHAINPGFFQKNLAFVRFLFMDLPLFLRHVFLIEGYNKKKIFFVIIYKLQLAEIMKKDSSKTHRIYDQGPIYSLCRLLNKSSSAEHERIADLVDILIERIKRVFDETIYINCDDQVALQRVLNRDTSHMYKERDRESVMSDIAVWKKNFDYIHSRIDSRVIVNNN